MKSKLLLAFLLLCQSMNVVAQWQQTNGPYGGNVRDVLVSGSNIFAATYGSGVYLSTNNCSSWTTLNNGLANNYAKTIWN